MPPPPNNSSPAVARDAIAGVVVFLVALPLCLGVALASGADAISGVIAGIVGGVLVGLLSGSHTSVAGPAAGLTAVVFAQIAAFEAKAPGGGFRIFLLAVFYAGLFQIALGLFRAGGLAAFVPTSVIKGLLAAIGVILILKQIPHVFGHDADPEGDMAFFQPDQQNTFTELWELLGDFHPGAAGVGVLSVLFLVVWDRIPALKKSLFPAPLGVVLFGVAAVLALRGRGPDWDIQATHLVNVPTASDFVGMLGFLRQPDFTRWADPAVLVAALTLAAVASLETLLNLEAVDKLDPRQRTSPPSRELLAQGAGNVASGLLGGLPVTSVIVRSSVNIHAGARTKLSTVVHGFLLLVCVALLPQWLNRIPLSCLAAILLVTGVKLASPALLRQMWRGGWQQFLPFVTTVTAIVFTDLLIGVLIGLAVSLFFIVRSTARRPVRASRERHFGGEVTRVELANQVTFLNRGALQEALDAVPEGGNVLLDATNTSYIDPDVTDMLRDYVEVTAPARGVSVSTRGFSGGRLVLPDRIAYVDYSSGDIQKSLTPAQVLNILKDGHERFRTGRRLTRDLGRLVSATATGQHPIAVVLSCIDSRTPAELIFDLGVGDIFVVRVAGNVTSRKILGSIEYGCAVAGAKLVLVMGHTRCGAVTAAVDLAESGADPVAVTGCEHIAHVVGDIQAAIDPASLRHASALAGDDRKRYVDDVARRNVLRGVAELRRQSGTLDRLAADGRIAVVGALYDVATGELEFLPAAE